MAITYISSDAELDDLILRTKRGTAELREILDSQPTPTETPPAPPSASFPWAVALASALAGAGIVGIFAWVL